MKRIDIHYDGQLYSVGGRDLDELLEEIADGLRGGVHWLRVNDGAGNRRDAMLSLTPGVPIAVIPIPGDDEPESPEFGKVS
ncbi:hypothetical protein [Glutamicibacter protophormiae]|uniref:hypothetical protein n=1 Tax=Glutamicibacter protophormiae TaxID=37930 RepID=UPI003A8C8C25